MFNSKHLFQAAKQSKKTIEELLDMSGHKLPKTPIEFYEALFCWETVANFRKGGFSGMESLDFQDILSFLELREIPKKHRIHVIEQVSALDAKFKYHADKNKPKK